MDEQYEYISVSELAERLGVSSQTIRNRIKDGLIETTTWRRGKMIGILCKVKKEIA
jgi:excisionase family DNA binding protein